MENNTTVEENKENDLNDSTTLCAICLDQIVMTCRPNNPCDHRFCFECLFKWSKLQNMCPLCQRQYKRVDFKIQSEKQLNKFETILTGIKRESNSKKYTLRKLLKSSKWKGLDNFWHRMVSTGIIYKSKIIIVLVIDANKERNQELIDKRIEEIVDCVSDCVDTDRFGRVIDCQLKDSTNNIFLMTLIVCCRKRSKDKK